MNDRRSPEDLLDGFLSDLADDALRLSDGELREELREHGESPEDYSAQFQHALRAAEARLRLRQSAPGLVPIEAVPFSPQTLRAFPAIERVPDLFGDDGTGSKRIVRYRGDLDELLAVLPEFEEADFTLGPTMPRNPNLRSIVRKPDGRWTPMAVGTVSNTYALVQHRETVQMCLRGLERRGLRRDELRGELALSALGEWMNFTFVLPRKYFFRDTYGHDLDFRCQVRNSVDGSSRLEVWFDWFREVCSNGLAVRERKTTQIDHREERLNDLAKVERRIFGQEPSLFRAGYEDVFDEGRELAFRLSSWQRKPVSKSLIAQWVDSELKKKWKDHAAGRVYSICVSGHDSQFTQGTRGRPSTFLRERRKVGTERRVPGSPYRAKTKYDVAQAMSWVASRKTNIVERVRWQAQIPALLDCLDAA